ncbi:MAG: glycoside hydrolase domain-containing protein [Terriglobia bacterium]|jgi:hypothetical protein
MGDTEKPIIDGPPYWGVDSVKPANQPVGGSKTPTLYDYVLEKSKGRPPAFFGRYLTAARNKEQLITETELQFLSDRNCRILLNYNQLSSGAVQQPFPFGQMAADKAANAASDLGAPSSIGSPSVWIYANIDAGYSPKVEWILGWWDGLWKHGYGPGIYFQLSAGSTKIAQAIETCGTIPKIELWCSVWSWASQHFGSRNVEANTFAPFPVKGHPSAVEVWQYGAKCFPYGGTPMFDMSLANQQGYDRMWEY